jgi:hypothetical protein
MPNWLRRRIISRFAKASSFAGTAPDGMEAALPSGDAPRPCASIKAKGVISSVTSRKVVPHFALQTPVLVNESTSSETIGTRPIRIIAAVSNILRAKAQHNYSHFIHNPDHTADCRGRLASGRG